MLNFFSLAICVFSAVTPAVCILQEIPGLYIDRFTLWKSSGVSHNNITGGYNFSVTWRYTLPGVHSSALGMSTFKTGAGKVLNMQAEMTSVTTSESTINIKPLSNNSGIVYVSYSVVVITQSSSPYLQILSVKSSGLQTYKLFTKYIEVRSTKFTFGSSAHQVNHFIQWISTVNNKCGYSAWYWIMLRISTIVGTSIVRMPYYLDNDIQAVKVNVLIVSKQIGSQSASFYSTYSQTGSFNYSSVSSYSYQFTYNFGLNASQFGGPTSGYRCINGLTSLFLNCPYKTCKVNSFLLGMNGNQVGLIAYENADLIRMDTICYGIGVNCPLGTFYNATSLSCDSCSQGCNTCDNNGVCSSCAKSNSSAANISCVNSLTNNSAYWYELHVSNATDVCSSNSGGSSESGDETEESSSKIWIFFLIFGLMILFIITFMCCSVIRRNRDLASAGGEAPESNARLETVEVVGQWKDIQNQRHIEENPICSICLCEWSGFESACGHFFHIECIVQWSKRKCECTLCRQSLSNKIHTIFCTRCAFSQKEMSFKLVRQMYEKKEMNQNAVCEDCKGIYSD